VTRWDKPEVSLKTNRRVDRVSKSSEFDADMVSPWNSKVKALTAFIELCKRLPARNLLISYNNESIVPLDQLTEALEKEFGPIDVEKISYQRNIMAQIGNAALYNDTFKTENVEVLMWVKVNA
jgi:adenine-specific DNA methylase